MVLTPKFYLANFMTGRMEGPVLPMDSISVSSSLAPGQFTARTDMRKAAGSFGEAKSILDLLRNGKCTLVPVLEGLNAGHSNPEASRAMGEWWIADVNATHSNPIVTLSGPEFAGYFKHLLTTAKWSSTFDTFLLVRDMIREATRTSQTIQLSTGTGGGGPLAEVDLQQSKVNYWDGITAAQDGQDSFEWRVSSALRVDGVAPVSVGRSLQLQAPVLRWDRTSITLVLSTPGTHPGLAADMTRGWSETASASTVYGFGAGGGDDQISAWTSRSREVGEPGKSRMITVRDALTYPQLKRATARAVKSMSPEDRVFQVVMPAGQVLPTVGEVYTLIREPSWSMPDSWKGPVRVVGWSWTQPRPGERDAFVLDLVED